MNAKDFRSLVFFWNEKYPCDRWFREKYKISWNGSAHREHNIIDMYYEYIEDSIFGNFQKTAEEDRANLELLKKGIWLKETIEDQDVSDDIFDKLDLFNSGNISVEE